MAWNDAAPELDSDEVRRRKRAAWLRREAAAMRTGAMGRPSGRALAFRRYAVHLEEMVSTLRDQPDEKPRERTLLAGEPWTSPPSTRSTSAHRSGSSS